MYKTVLFIETVLLKTIGFKIKREETRDDLYFNFRFKGKNYKIKNWLNYEEVQRELNIQKHNMKCKFNNWYIQASLI